MFGISGSLVSSVSGTPTPAFTPASLPLTGWWQGSYTAAPWVGSASVGSTFNLVTNYSDPTSATAVNGYNPALFTGASVQLLVGGASAQTLTSIWSSTAGSFWCLFYANTAGTPGAAVYDDQCLFGDHYNGEIGFGFTTDGITSCIYNSGGSGYIQHTIACGIGAWHLAQWKWDGTNTYGRLDGGSWTTYADGGTWTMQDGTATNTRLAMGASYSNSVTFDGMMLDCGVSNTVISDLDFTNIVTYANIRYGLAL